ncbi:MAG TPA: AAA family ATPase [Micavibrio sp.]|nr:AAA family ATPase [Micavibrio sp.]
MLKKLRIEQFVIIDKLDLDLQTGLTILTGETGAGKSILLDATGLILGDPNDVEAIRTGQDESLIEGVLTPPADNPVWPFLVQQGIVSGPQPELTVYRTIRRNGGGDIRVNGKPVDLDTLKKMGTYLAEIHGQFANQSLLAPENQLNLLDLSGNFPPEIFKNVADALDQVHQYTKELEEENLFLANHKRETPKIEEVCGKFEKLGMTYAGYVNDTVNEYARLLTAKETSETFQSILAQLISANGVVMSLSGSAAIIERNPNLEEEKMEVLLGHLKTSLEHSRAAVTEMRRIAPDYDIDTEPIYRLEAILEGLKRIAKENKLQFEDLATFWEDRTTKLARLRAGRETIKRLQDQLIEAKNNYRHHAHILHEKRVVAGEELSAEITRELAPLKLNKAEFKVVVEERANMTWTAKGLDHVVFTARMNPGMPFSPVSETASGGELARLILALKVVVQKVQTIPTLIFDEVDTGIGGAAAAAVGERLALLAESTQVLVITHSPQVASRGDLHLHVSKKTDGITTLSVVNQLTHDERVDEISRMLAGDKITTEATAAAQSLINESKNAASARRGSGGGQQASI